MPFPFIVFAMIARGLSDNFIKAAYKNNTVSIVIRNQPAGFITIRNIKLLTKPRSNLKKYDENFSLSKYLDQMHKKAE